MHQNYIDSAKQQFEYYKSLGEKAFNQLEDEKLFWQYNESSNSIATIVEHLWGNMLSRWTNFFTSDGEKETRNRESEFDNDIATKNEMMQKWNDGWLCLFNALNEINETNFTNTIYIRNQGHTVSEAINRQLCHYAYHVGQIVFVGKMIKDEEWKSLSIPRGKSQTYNTEKFAQPKHHEHFTKEFVKNKDEEGKS